MRLDGSLGRSDKVTRCRDRRYRCSRGQANVIIRVPTISLGNIFGIHFAEYSPLIYLSQSDARVRGYRGSPYVRRRPIQREILARKVDDEEGQRRNKLAKRQDA